MASNTIRNSPASARRAREKDPEERIDSQATVSTEADLTTIFDAISALQKVDVQRLQRQFKLQTSVPRDLKNGHDEQGASIKLGQKSDCERTHIDLRENDDELDPAQKDIKRETNDQLEEKEKELKIVRDKINMNNQPSSEQEDKILQLKLSLDAANKDVKSLNQKVMECQNELKAKERSLKEQEKTMEDLKRAKDEALIRLSHEIGQKVSDGNPNITDLSDHNRPTKLGEIYSELYDNEWTNAFDVLTQTFQLNEKDAIAVLLKILQESSKYASDLSQSNMKKIEKFIVGSSEEAYTKNFAKCDERTYMKKEQVDIYSKKCFQLCWLMSIQDPPVVLSKDPKRGSCFDTNIYKLYTHSGDKFDYVVWPALLLHNGGPLLAKGVAQPYSALEANSTPTVWRSTSKDDNSFDGTSEEKYSDSASGSDRMDKKQDVYQTRGDGALSSKSGPRLKFTQTSSADGSKHKAYSPKPITSKNVHDSELSQKFQRMRDKRSKTLTEHV